jgi:hypothetical protein
LGKLFLHGGGKGCRESVKFWHSICLGLSLALGKWMCPLDLRILFNQTRPKLGSLQAYNKD